MDAADPDDKKPKKKDTYAKRGRPRARLVALASLMTVVQASCGSGDREANTGSGQGGEPVRGGDLVYVLPTKDDETRSLDPSVNPPRTFGHIVINAIYDPLLVQDPETGELEGLLAESWNVSDDGLRINMKLRDDVVFHDGNPFTAKAVKYTLDRATSEEYAPENAYPSALLAAYDRTEIKGEHSIVIHLKEPQANFLQSALARDYMGIVSPEAVESAGVPAFGDQPVGTGPFKFVEWQKGSHIRVERFEEYTWGPAFAENQGPAYLDSITFRYIAEPSTRVSTLLSGGASAINGVPPADVERIESNDDFEVHRFEKSGLSDDLIINHQSPPMDDRAVRLALAYAIDKEGLNQAVFHGVHEPTSHLLERRMWSFSEEAMIPPGGETDKAEAERVLDEAGWVPGDDGVRVKGGERLSLRVITLPQMSRAVEFLKEDVSQVGIELNIVPLSQAAMQEAHRSGDFDLSLENIRGWTNEDPHSLYSRYHSSLMPPQGDTNTSFYSSETIDNLVEQGYSELNRDKREALYVEAQKILSDDVATIPLVSELQIDATQAGVHGLREDIRGTYRYWWDTWMESSLH